MAMNPGDSVRMNLSDLFELEAERREQLAAAEERDRAEAVSRIARERAERERSLRAAEDLARARERQAVEAGRLASERRIHDLRADLAAVRASRHRTQLHLAALVSPPDSPDRGRSVSAGALAAVSLVAAITATLAAWPRTETTATDTQPAATETTATQPAATEPSAIQPAAEPVVQRVEPAADLALAVPASVHRAQPPRGDRQRPPADDLGAPAGLRFGRAHPRVRAGAQGSGSAPRPQPL